MKMILFGIAIFAITASACNNESKNNSEKNIDKDTTSLSNSSENGQNTSNNDSTIVVGTMKEILNQYLQIKNALADDNGKDAANAGNAFVISLSKIETASFTAAKKQTWNELSDDAKEMAEHIGTNADKIEHQREHFEMLSKDMYDMVKTFGVGQTLYQDFCPMYNDNKGALWLSEIKEIKNPYLGKKMPDCGTVREEIK